MHSPAAGSANCGYAVPVPAGAVAQGPWAGTTDSGVESGPAGHPEDGDHPTGLDRPLLGQHGGRRSDQGFTGQPTSPKTVGIDVGTAVFATLSDGTVIQNPRYLHWFVSSFNGCSLSILVEFSRLYFVYRNNALQIEWFPGARGLEGENSGPGFYLNVVPRCAGIRG